MKREPSLIIATIAALLALLAGFGLPFLTADQAGAATAAITAGLGIWNGLKVRPVSPAIFTYGVATVATLLATYGVDLSQEKQSLINAAVVAVLALALRGNVSPTEPPPPVASSRLPRP